LLGQERNWPIYGSLENWRRRRDFNANQSGANTRFSQGNPAEIHVIVLFGREELLKRSARFLGCLLAYLRHFGHGHEIFKKTNQGFTQTRSNSLASRS
jgi:hypothetical protein